MIGQLGQSLGRCDADAHRQAQPIGDPLPDFSAIGGQATVRQGQARQFEERLVDAIDLEIRRETGQDFDDPIAEVGIEGVVGTERDDAMPPGFILDLEPGDTHGNAERLDLGAAGDDTAVVVGEDDDRTVSQAWVEQLLAARVEVVAIDQGKDRHRDQAAKRLNLPTTTPQTSSSMPS